MKLTKKLLPLTGAAALAVSALATPMAVQAETSASMAFSNMYLWRGQNLAPDGSVISGSIDYSNESGVYLGAWTTSESEGHETDLYVGYSGAAGDISYDVSYWMYLYNEDGADGPDPANGISDTNLSELVGSVGVNQFTFGLKMGIDTEFLDEDPGDYFYYTIDFAASDTMNFQFGGWLWDDREDADYTHLTFSYSPLDELSFAVSIAQEDGTDTIEEDPLFAITYSKGFDLSK